MYVRRRIRWRLTWKFAWRNVLFFLAWSTAVTTAHELLRARGVVVSLPFVPLATIGTAVAIYLGFKSSQSYDRLWEARKIWGGVVNTSRTWAAQVIAFVGAAGGDADAHARARTRLVYRTLAWTQGLRMQLRRTTIFDRDNLTYVPDLGLRPGRECDDTMSHLLDPDEYRAVVGAANPATQLLRRQAEDLRDLRASGALADGFAQSALMDSVRELYDLQGRCERIKTTPFPRQYAYFSAVFVWIFVALLPFGLLAEFAGERGGPRVWLTVPFSVVIAWIFTTMEIVGDNSEDPFENYINDVPMTALCRTIEIDLREMLGEADIPPKLLPVDDILL